MISTTHATTTYYIYSYTDKSANDLAKKLLTYLQTGKMCGRVTVISWKHSQISHIARHLGCGPAQGCPYDYRGWQFDDTWHLKVRVCIHAFIHTYVANAARRCIICIFADWRY